MYPVLVLGVLIYNIIPMFDKTSFLAIRPFMIFAWLLVTFHLVVLKLIGSLRPSERSMSYVAFVILEYYYYQ